MFMASAKDIRLLFDIIDVLAFFSFGKLPPFSFSGAKELNKFAMFWPSLGPAEDLSKESTLPKLFFPECPLVRDCLDFLTERFIY